MPHEVTSYESAYTAKVNTYGFLVLLLHLPILCVVGLYTHVSLVLITGMMLLVLSGPGAILIYERSSRLGAIAIAVASMGVVALTIFVCRGMIEAHFEIFVLIALLIVYGRVAPLLVAAVTNRASPCAVLAVDADGDLQLQGRVRHRFAAFIFRCDGGYSCMLDCAASG
jgi:hypothetical protein